MSNSKLQIVDAIIIDKTFSKVLLQKRSPSRKLFPNMWDLIGGHKEQHESTLDCLAREIAEEVNLELTDIMAKVHEFNWQDGTLNYVYLVKAQGRIIPEIPKVTEVRWCTKQDVLALFERGEISVDLFQAIVKSLVWLECGTYNFIN